MEGSDSTGGDGRRTAGRLLVRERLHVPREGFGPCLSLTDLSCLSILVLILGPQVTR